MFLSREEIQKIVARLAKEINRDYQGKAPLLVGILKGSFVFMADLIRLLDIPLEVDFAILSSYGSGTVTSGQVAVIQEPRGPLEGRDVLVTEDIVDSGTTLNFFVSHLWSKNPSSLKVCALFDKPTRRGVPVAIDYCGFTVPDKFLVGYGLDCDEKYRNLPDLCILEDGE